MAELSNQLMALTVLAYLVAMVCYAGEYAFGQRSRVGRAAARELVGAGAPVSPESPVSPAPPTPPAGRGDLVGRIAVVLTVLGVALHLGTTVTRGIAADRINVISKGKEAPVCTEAAESCWQQNRRGHPVFTAK